MTTPWLFVPGAVLAAAVATAPPQVTVARQADRITVEIEGKPFTALHTSKDVRKLYLHPVLTSTGKRVTRAFPMEQVAGESTDHPHQRGIWIGAERVNGLDFWENEWSEEAPNKGSIVLTDVGDVQSGAAEGRVTVRADWRMPNGETLLTESRTMTFSAPAPSQRTIDIDLRLVAKKTTTFEDDHDNILGLRLGTEFEEGHGGQAINAEGIRGWEKLRGARSAWVDWRATIDGERVGVAVMDSPTNFRFPTPWHVRDYALLFASPFAFRTYDKAAVQDGTVTLKPGDALALRYRILVHSGDIDVAGAFKAFAGR